MNDKKIPIEEFEKAAKISGFTERDTNIAKAVLIEDLIAAEVASLYGIGRPRVSQIVNKFQEFLPQESAPPGWREITVSLPVGIAGAVEQLSVTLKKEWESPHDS